MILPTAEQILSSLPFTITLWTAITLGWGVYVYGAFIRMLTHSEYCGVQYTDTNVWNIRFMLLMNIVLVVFLWLEPLLANYADTIIVVNVFYSVYLFPITLNLCRWWSLK